ncbi:MAG: hypothetical protein ACRYGP_15045 [Janthinobacterium lividum]
MRRRSAERTIEAGLLGMELRDSVLKPDRALRRHDAELGKVPAQSVD